MVLPVLIMWIRLSDVYFNLDDMMLEEKRLWPVKSAALTVSNSLL